MKFSLVAGAIAANLSLYAQATIAAPLDVAVEDAASPWSSKDGTGFANDTVEAAFKAVGMHVNFKVVPYTRCKYMVKKGTIAVCFSVSPEPGLEKSIILSEKSLFRLQCDYYMSLDRPLQAKRSDELPPGSVVGIVNGYEYPESVERLKERGVVLEGARDEAANLKKLALGRIDAAIINHNEIKRVDEMLRKAGVVGKVRFAFPAGVLEAYVGFSKSNPLGREMKARFDQGYEIIKRNGVFDKITAKWRRRLRERFDDG